jgi:protein-glutamine gamma-glutamyltransferase
MSGRDRVIGSARVELGEPRLAAFLRPLIYMSSAFVFAFPLATLEVALAISALAGTGAVLGRFWARSRLRSLPIAVLGLLLAVVAGQLRSLLLTSPAFAGWFGPAEALGIANALGLGLGTACVAAVVRVLALRWRPFRALEVGFVGLSFAQLVAAHRGGSINRPFELADSIIAQGGDPTIALLAVGAVAALASVVLLLSEGSLARSAMHLLVALAMLAIVLGATRMLGLPHAKIDSEGLGLRPKEGDKEGGKPRQGRGGGRGSQQSDNEQLDFRDNYDSNGRQIPLAVVLLHDDYSPPSGLYYFRQAAFSQYNGRRLVSATRQDVDRDIAPGFVFARTTLPPVPNDLNDRARLETTVALLAEHNRPFALESPIELRPEQNPDPGRFRRAYRVVSEALDTDYQTFLGRGVGDPKWTDEQREHYVRAPSDPRYGELAAQIAAGVPEHMKDDPVAKGMMVSLWLGREAIYSLRSGHAAAEDPTADFLFGDRTGYCVHFAHAAVYLMRALGLPSRVGAGYVVEESARQGGSAILLSGANSHAWPEMYVSGVGWVIVDIAPEHSLDPPVSAPDADLQRLLGEMARGQKPLPQGGEKLFDPVVAAVRKAQAALVAFLLIAVPVLLLLGYGVKGWRRLAPFWASAGSAPRLAYRAELDRLSEVALVRGFGESREAFAARIAAQSPSFGSLTSEHVGARFGARARLDRAALRRLARSVRLELASAVSARRRVLGLLHPFSWFGSR